MKQCPSCKNTYTDDSLQFCLSDGTPLLSAANDAPPTVLMSFDKQAPERVNIPFDSTPTVFAPPTFNQNPPAKKGYGLIIGGVLGILLLLIGGGLTAFLLFSRSGDDKSSVPTPIAASSLTAAPSASPTVAANDETARLKEEMANLKKQIEAQKKQNSSSPAETLPPPDKIGKTAYANSPNDGFLALRSEPNSETGYRLAKIPHGAALTVLNCPKPSNDGKMPGRWCRVTYEGQSGWAFDKYMRF